MSFHLAKTADGVKESSVLKMVPCVCSHLTLPTHPAPVSKMEPVSGHLLVISEIGVGLSERQERTVHEPAKPQRALPAQVEDGRAFPEA